MRSPNWLVGAAALTVFAACTSDAEPEPSITDSTIIVGLANDAPGFAHGDLNPTGFDVKVMEAIGHGLEVTVINTRLASKDREQYLKDKKATIIVHTYSITEDRNKADIDFAGPYMVTPQALLVRAGENAIRTKDDLVGRSVCTVSTTTGAAVDLPGANMETKRPTTKECVELLGQGGTDAVFTDTLVLHGYSQTYPGQYEVVLSEVFGQLQYYGIGLLAGRKADCEKLNGVIREYLRTQWLQDFMATLPEAAAAHTGSDADGGNFESLFKPTDTDMSSLSCKLERAPS